MQSSWRPYAIVKRSKGTNSTSIPGVNEKVLDKNTPNKAELISSIRKLSTKNMIPPMERPHKTKQTA